MRWIPSQRFFVEAGGTLSRQFYLALPIARQDIAGIYTRMHYSLARNVRLNVWGQYFMGGNTPPPVYNPLFPHTGVGASISVDVKKNTEVKSEKIRQKRQLPFKNRPTVELHLL
mgnify:CR=1 FL=1